MKTITLVIIMTIGGQDFERHETMKSVSECFARAQERTNILLGAEIEDHKTVTQIGAGCVIDYGSPA